MYHEGNQELSREQQFQLDERRVALYLAKVMGWMCVGLLTTLVSAMLCLTSPAVIYFFHGTNAIFAVFLAQLGVVALMSFAVNRIGPGLATVLFMIYAAFTGITFSALALVFELGSIILVFGITAVIFIGMSAYGFATRRDLTRIGVLAMFALIGLILAGVVNMFLQNSMFGLIVTCVGILVFIVLIAYDTQKIKGIYMHAVSQGFDEDSPEVRKLAIFGALSLYLDFINLFLRLLTLLGRRRS